MCARGIHRPKSAWDRANGGRCKSSSAPRRRGGRGGFFLSWLRVRADRRQGKRPNKKLRALRASAVRFEALFFLGDGRREERDVVAGGWGRRLALRLFAPDVFEQRLVRL